MQGSNIMRFLRRMWRVVRWLLLAIIVIYIGIVIWDIPNYLNRQKTAEAVAAIHAQKITMADVDGSHLPPAPDPKLVDATVAGIDENNNGIRDDVERAIFKKYPGQSNLKIRAAALQYAMALQNELTRVVNSQTLVAVLWNESRAYFCADKVLINASNAEFDSKIFEIKNLIFNNRTRLNFSQEVRVKYMTSHAIPSNNFCDV